MTIRSNIKANQTTRMNVLTPDQCQELVYAAEEAMWRTGTNFHDEESLEILKKAGCWVEGTRAHTCTHL